ncbi:MAG: branched-chain amino acid ABC transporter permease [Acidimicrobiia bacterium]|nr:branched-chain amino acid ABC transporter permease [Acidimicrobiia bacterium]
MTVATTGDGRLYLPGRVKVYLAIAALAVVVGIPVFGSTLMILRATEVAIFSVAFAGLHILSGRLGLISVGHGAFIGIGAIGAAHTIDDLGVPYLLAPLAGAICGALFGALIGVPSLRLPGAYLALLTLAMAMVLPIAMRQIDGPLGYRVDGDLHPPTWTGLDLSQINVWQYILVVVVGAATLAVLRLAIGGRFTRSLIAARDEPTAAAAFGINVSRVRLIGVILSAALAGTAGGLSLYPTPLVAGSHYPFSLSVSMFALMLALGASRLWIVLPASIVLVMLPNALISLGWPVWEPIIYAALLLLMTRVSRGQGLVSLFERPPAPVPIRTSVPTLEGPRFGGGGRNPFLLTAEPRSRT